MGAAPAGHARVSRAMPPVIYKDSSGKRLPSVTTIISRFKDSGGLLYWANQQGLEGKTLDQARAEVTTPGTLAHKAVEDHINGRPETALSGDGDAYEKARSAYGSGDFASLEEVAVPPAMPD
jgi:hypothetical protein